MRLFGKSSVLQVHHGEVEEPDADADVDAPTMLTPVVPADAPVALDSASTLFSYVHPNVPPDAPVALDSDSNFTPTNIPNVQASPSRFRSPGLLRLPSAIREELPGGTQAAGFCFSLIAVGVILFFMSFQTLPQYRYGLKKHSAIGTVDLSMVYEPGLHMIGFWNEFLEIPSTIGTLSFASEDVEEGVAKHNPIALRSKDKVSMTLEISVQYARRKGALPQLYLIAKSVTTQENLLASKIRAALMKVMSKRKATDCWSRRHELTVEFYQACQSALDVVHVDCWGLQFYQSHVPKLYGIEFVKTHVQKQETKLEEADKRVQSIKAETEVLLASHGKDQTMIESVAAAKRYRIEEAAKTAAEAATIHAAANVMQYVKNTLSAAAGATMTDEQYTEYQKRMALSNLKQAPLYYASFEDPQYLSMPARMAPSSPDDDVLAGSLFQGNLEAVGTDNFVAGGGHRAASLATSDL